MNGSRRWLIVLKWIALATVGIPGAARAQAPHLEALRQKNFGVAYLEQRRVEPAEAAFYQVVELAPGEALGYANLAMCCLRRGRLAAAQSWIDQAWQRAPGDIQVLLRRAEVQLSSGAAPQAITSFAAVLDLDSRNLMARYGLVVALNTRQDDPAAARRVSQEVEKLYEIAPRNIEVALRRAQVAVQAGDFEVAAQTLSGIRMLIDDLPAAQDLLEETLRSVQAKETAAVNQLRMLTNLLRPTARYRQALAELQPPLMGIPLEKFSDGFYDKLLRERPPRTSLRFRPVEFDDLPGDAVVSGPVANGSLDFADVDRDGREDVLAAGATQPGGALQLWLSASGKWTKAWADKTWSPARAARFVDFNDDGQFDVVAVGDESLQLLSRDDLGQWRDVTEVADLSREPGTTLELLDADNEGDLDLCVATPLGFRLWQHRGDGTYRSVEERAGLSDIGGGCRQIMALDYDEDLDADLCVIDAKKHLVMYANLRHGRFQQVDCGLDVSATSAFLVADLDNDGREDLLQTRVDGSLWWQPNRGSRFAPAMRIADLAGVEQVEVFDGDNDQWLDVIASSRQDQEQRIAVCRNLADGTWLLSDSLVCDQHCAALNYADVNADGALDIVALNSAGQLQVWQNVGGEGNHWLRVKLLGLRQGGAKNNLHGLGSKLEVKSKADYQARFVRRPVTHFGLGPHTQADLLRVIWSNGVPQNQFRPAADQAIREVQVLKGSCPYLYCWDGDQFAFVTDLLAAAPLGLRPAEGVIAPDNPRELMTIPRGKVAKQNGEFVFQFTSELWETVYLDEVSLWVVDHPAGIDVFTDQRFHPPPYAPPSPIFTGQRLYPRRATSSAGEEVTESLRYFDHRYPEKLVPTRFQGIVRPHELTLEFGAVDHLERPLLVVGCWIFWTDTSINVAASQAKHPLPQPTELAAWDPQKRTWRTVPLPFWLPNGKDKWVVLDLTDFVASGDARLRLRTSSQIYWDQVFLADAAPSAPHQVTRLVPRHADLHFGGFHRLYRPTPDGPHLYDYSQTSELPLWATMTGLATRYGEVTELLTSPDDRLAIFTGGDEVTIRFAADALPTLPHGWVRDFLFYSDGWEKDSDRNTLTGETVDPLPFHGMSAYPYPPAESYPDDQIHREYRDEYNTRPIGPAAFRRYVKDFQGGRRENAPWANEPHVRGEIKQ